MPKIRVGDVVRILVGDHKGEIHDVIAATCAGKIGYVYTLAGISDQAYKESSLELVPVRRDVIGMTGNQYQELAMRTATVDPENAPVIKFLRAMGMDAQCAVKMFDENALFFLALNGVLGLNGEAGEVIDIFKKTIFQGHTMDKQETALELGDALWYVAILAKGLGYTLEEIMQLNVDKLRKRYPEGFEADRSINRDA